jgi:hypothetical protein
VTYIGQISRMFNVMRTVRAAKPAALTPMNAACRNVIRLLSTLAVLFLVTPAQAQQGTWDSLPGTTMSSQFTSSDYTPAWGPWVGGAYNENTHEFYLIRNGGHADGDDPESYMLDLDGGPWTKVEPDQLMTGSRTNANGNCPFAADNTPPANHTYDGEQWLGGTRYLWTGSPWGCTGDMGTELAYTVDTSTTPWTWTDQPHLYPFAPSAGSAMKDGVLYIVGGNPSLRWAKVNPNTMAIIEQGLVGLPVVINGINQPTNTAFGSAVSSAAIVGDLFCMIRPDFPGLGQVGYCSRINGSVQGNNNDSFGRFLRRTIPIAASTINFGYAGLVAAPDGQRFVVWHGDNRIYTWDPDDNSLNPTPADVWTAYTPTGGPTTPGISKSERVYSKWFYAAHLNKFCGMPDPTQLLWCYTLPGSLPPPNTGPTAVNDTNSGVEDVASLTGNVLTNDTDPQGDTLNAAVVKNPFGGTLAMESDGDYSFVPRTNFNGTTTFEYRATDPGGLSDLGLATITLSAVNDTPIAIDDDFTGDVDEAIAGDVLLNDSDAEGTSLSTSVVTGPGIGNLVLNSNGSFIYTPESGFEGEASFIYSASDGAGSDTATVTLAVGDVGVDPDDPDVPLATLCALPGTLLCDPLDDTTPISGPLITGSTTHLLFSQTIQSSYGTWRRAFTTYGFPSPTLAPQLDNTVAVEGGSMKFTIRSESAGGTAGQYNVNINPLHTQTPEESGIEPGETIRMRVKVRWSCDVLFTDCPGMTTRRHYDVTSGFGGIKIFSIKEADRAPGNLTDGGEGIGTPIWANRFQMGAYAGYIGTFNEPIQVPYPPNYEDIQPGGPNPCVRTNQTLVLPSTCHMMAADEWVTMQMDLTYNGCSTQFGSGPPTAHVTLSIADEGEPFQVVIDTDTWLRCTDQDAEYPLHRLGKIDLTVYDTAKDPTEVHPEGYVWFDNLWVGKVTP